MNDLIIAILILGAMFTATAWISFNIGLKKGKKDYYDSLTLPREPFTED